jgi:hypothetical protein
MANNPKNRCKRVKKFNKLILGLSALLIVTTMVGINSVRACENYELNRDIPITSSAIKGFAQWKSSNGQAYLLINAQDYYSLGYLTGKGLVNQILTMDAIIKSVICSYGLNLQEILYYAQIYDLFIPMEYKNEMQGIADATSLTYLDVLLQEVFLDLYYGILIPAQIGIDGVGACTALAIKNTKWHATIGQNMDFGIIFLPTLAYVKYTVMGKQAVFSLRMGASTLAIGKNKRVSSTLTLVQTWKMANFGTPTGIKARIAFENCKTASEFFEVMTSSYCASWNYVISDFKGNIIAAETLPDSVIVKDLKFGETAVRTNTYISEALKMFLIDSTYSLPRQMKAEELLKTKQESKWIVREKDLMDILCFYDGTDASICRFPDSVDPTYVCTEAFFVSSGVRKGYFGIGNPIQSTWGRIPI